MEDRFREQWEENAQAFSDLIKNEGTPHHKFILNPCVEQLIGDVDRKKFLDAGCGEGYLSRFYAGKGAMVTGIDISPELITKARSISNDEKVTIEFREGDICNLEGIADESFDIVLANLVLLNIPCLQEALAQFERVLESGGMLVISIVHPAFNFYGPGTWQMGEKDPSTGRRTGLFFKVDQYFNEKEYERYWRTRTGDKFPEPFSFFHRTLSTYVNAIIDSGLRLERIDEPRPIKDDGFFDREGRVPFFMVFKAVKP
jgi:ubiquinone/menaquinone biosynthesis C-methylase UbiE